MLATDESEYDESCYRLVHSEVPEIMGICKDFSYRCDNQPLTVKQVKSTGISLNRGKVPDFCRETVKPFLLGRRFITVPQ